MKTLKLSPIMHQITAGNCTGNKISIFKKIACLGVFSLLVAGSVSAQLSGTYTIDSTKLASKTNYKSIISVISDLDSGKRHDGGTANGAGLSGPVVFMFADGVYHYPASTTNPTEIIIGAISGSSSTNTITFTSASGDSSKVLIENLIIVLSKASYIDRKSTRLNSS